MTDAHVNRERNTSEQSMGNITGSLCLTTPRLVVPQLILEDDTRWVNLKCVDASRSFLKIHKRALRFDHSLSLSMFPEDL